MIGSQVGSDGGVTVFGSTSVGSSLIDVCAVGCGEDGGKESGALRSEDELLGSFADGDSSDTLVDALIGLSPELEVWSTGVVSRLVMMLIGSDDASCFQLPAWIKLSCIVWLNIVAIS